MCDFMFSSICWKVRRAQSNEWPPTLMRIEKLYCQSIKWVVNEKMENTNMTTATKTMQSTPAKCVFCVYGEPHKCMATLNSLLGDQTYKIHASQCSVWFWFLTIVYTNRLVLFMEMPLWDYLRWNHCTGRRWYGRFSCGFVFM